MTGAAWGALSALIVVAVFLMFILISRMGQSQPGREDPTAILLAALVALVIMTIVGAVIA